MKKIKLFFIVTIAAMFVVSTQIAVGKSTSCSNQFKESFVAPCCTVIVTGRLHTMHSECKTGLGICIKIVIKLPMPVPDPTENAERINGIVNINPKNPNQVIVDFLHLDDEQMNESYWNLESDYVIDDPDLASEPGGYKSITLLKGNYQIDRSENRVGKCVVRCKVN